jgi:hypothetical protein
MFPQDDGFLTLLVEQGLKFGVFCLQSTNVTLDKFLQSNHTLPTELNTSPIFHGGIMINESACNQSCRLYYEMYLLSTAALTMNNLNDLMNIYTLT